MTNSVAKFEQSKQKMKSGANASKTMGQICKNGGAKWSKQWGKCAKNDWANLQRASNTQSFHHIASPSPFVSFLAFIEHNSITANGTSFISNALVNARMQNDFFPDF